MLKRIAIVLGYVLLVAAIIAVVVLAHISAKQHRSTQQVTGFSICIDGAEGHNLINEASMNRWLRLQGVHPEGCTIAQINLATLESVAMQHSAVAAANAFITHDGYIEMSIVQREPIMRLKVDGYNHYVARDGHIFRANDGYAAYVPVMTGGYKPFFDSDFTGNVANFVIDSVHSMKRKIDEIERMKFAIYRNIKRANNRLIEVRDSSIHKSWFMSKERHESLTEALKLYIEAYEHRHNDEERLREKRIEELDKQQSGIYDKINMMRKREADFENLKSFVDYISNDDFWGAEITQVVISESGSGDMLLKLIPRSGDFIIDFGEVTNTEQKLKALERFYSNVLSSVGWEAYNYVSVRYDGQLVCHEAPRKQE